MANRSFHRIAGSLEIEPVMLWASITVGATGAVSASYGQGIASVTRLSAGQYKISLADTYNKLLFADVSLLDTTDSDPTTVGVLSRIKSEQVASTTAPQIVIQCFNTTNGAAADPRNGALLLVKIEVRNSSVQA